MAKSFIVDFGLKMRGAAWAKNISDTLAALMVYLYVIKVSSILKNSTTHTTQHGWNGTRLL
jgi:Na+-driven multidrug efflux pump